MFRCSKLGCAILPSADGRCVCLQASSRCGTPDELKAMIDEAHHLGLTVRTQNNGFQPAWLHAVPAMFQHINALIMAGLAEAILHVYSFPDPHCSAFV